MKFSITTSILICTVAIITVAVIGNHTLTNKYDFSSKADYIVSVAK